MTQVTALKPGSASPWNLSFEYPFTNALSDVYAVVRRNGVVLQESYYDAFGRRRAKKNGIGDAQEFTYDLGHQLLVDQTYSTAVVGGTADEYIWLDGRPVLAFRSNLSSSGTHENDYVEAPDTRGDCTRPLDDGTVQCGLFHLVSNLQGFVNLAMHDYDGKVASFQLPDADGTVNQARMNTFGGYGTAWAHRFDVPSSFSKQARFRTSWTGAVPGYSGVNSFELDGTTVLPVGGSEIGRAWSLWSPVTTGTNDVVWSTSCGGACASASDMFEWKVWETGAAQFHTRLRFPGQYHDSETDLYENWNRYYEPTTGRYLSPEPKKQDAKWIRHREQRGIASASFGYAAGNPIHFVDPDGLEFINSSRRTVAVKSESGGWGLVPPHQRYPGKIDGWKDPQTGKLFKVPGKEYIPFDNRIQCSDGKKKDDPPRYDCTGGPCRLSSPTSPKDLPDRPEWQVPPDVAPFKENTRL